MKKFLIFISSLLFLSANSIHSSNSTIKETDMTLSTSSGNISGVLREPVNLESKTVAIIISGAARTDRDGNQPQTKNNSLKMLAEELVKNNMSVLNFDKRGVARSQRSGSNEAKVTIDTYIEDAKAWADLLKTENKFEEVIIIGHGEGSLIGMMASINNANVNKFISIAGTSKKASDATKEQFENQPANIKNAIFANIEKLEKGERIANVPQEWSILFRSSLQPFLISLYKHDPKEEIAMVNIPTLIIQGDKDIQASTEDAELLANASPKAEKIIIENMNYVLKVCDKMGQQNQLDTYLRPNHPLNTELVPAIVNFVFH